MESITNNAPLIVILGPTASGKTALAIQLASQFDGEIIAADSRTVYKGMDIATAKPNAVERSEVRHHLLDVVKPNEVFTVADFKRLANAAIKDIASRGKIPFLVGGSGLYIDAVIYNYGLRPVGSSALRDELNQLSVEELQERLRQKSIPLPRNDRNPRHLIRAIETGGILSKKEELRPKTLVLGLDPDREVLQAKITARVDAMVNDGLVSEVYRLATEYGWNTPAMQTPGYRAFRSYLDGTASIDQAKKLFVQADLQYSKRQKTWFKRNRDILWISKTTDLVDLVTTFLSK